MLENKNIQFALAKIGQYYTAELKKQLKKEKHIATRELDASISATVKGNTLNILSKKYLGSISEGSKSYSKATDKRRIDRFVRWMKAKHIVPRAGRDKRGRFKKNTKSEANYRRSAWKIAQSVGIKGIRGSSVIQKAYKRIEKSMDKELVEGFKLYIDSELDKIIIK